MNWGIYDKIKNEWYSFLKDTGTPVSTAELATIARTWKQPRCPSTDVVHICNGILLSHKKGMNLNQF